MPADSDAPTPLPTREDGVTDYPGILTAMGLSLGDAFRIDGDVYRFRGLKQADEPYAAVTELTSGGQDPRTEVRVDTLWWDYHDDDLDVGDATVTFTPAGGDA